MRNDILVNPKTQNDLELFANSQMHALLLEGSEHSGKGFLARHTISKFIITKKDPSKLRIIEGREDSSIEAIRDLQTFLKLRVHGDEQIKRAVLIKDLDEFGAEAQNALLKTLEEPPMDTVIITTASDSSKLLSTIKSRMNSITVHPVTLEKATNYFKEHSPEKIKEAYFLSDGRPAILISLLNEADLQASQLVKNIGLAKELLSMNVYERLIKVDEISKLDIAEQLGIISALQKVLRAVILHGKKALTFEQKNSRVKQLVLLQEASKHIEARVQSKAVLCNLFINL